MTEGFFTIVEAILVTERKLKFVDSNSEDLSCCFQSSHTYVWLPYFPGKGKLLCWEKKEKNQCSVVSVSVRYGLNS